jgi:hypothetical protein
MVKTVLFQLFVFTFCLLVADTLVSCNGRTERIANY